MAEIPYIIKNLFNKGLRDDDKNSLDMGAGSIFKMIEPLVWGSREYTAITALIGASELTAESITISHPFPQVFKGKHETLLLTATGLWTVDEDTSLLTAVTTFDPDTPASTKNIETGGVWQFADFHNTWFLYNGVSIVFKSGHIDSTKVFTADIYTFNTGCNYKGRSIIGGFGSTDINQNSFWSNGWINLWRYMTNLEGGVSDLPSWPWTDAPPENSIAISSIGIADMPLMLLFPNEFFFTQTTSKNAMPTGGGAIAPTAGTESAGVITVDSDENIIKVLTTSSAPTVELIKMTKEGVQIFRKDISGDFTTDVRGLVTDSSDNIYISSGTTDKVYKYDSSGVLLTSFGVGGIGDGQFDDARGMAIDSNGKLHVCDASNDRIQIWTTAGVWESDYGSTGSGDTQLNGPLEIQIDDFDNRYIHDFTNLRFIKWDSNNAFISKLAITGIHLGLTFDNIGHIYVGKFTNTILKYDLNWNLLETLTNNVSIRDLTFDSEAGLLYISAASGLAIQLYRVSAEGQLLHLFERNEVSIMPMDYQGLVMNLQPLRNHVMCYGEDGISAITDHEKIGGNFGLEEAILKVGLASRGSVGGSLDRHLFVDITGVLWTIDDNLILTKLGYQEFFSAMLGNEITISYDPLGANRKGLYYVSDNAVCYSISGLPDNSKVAECPQLVNSAFQLQGAMVGVFAAASSPTAIDIKSGIIDFGYEDDKSVSWVKVDAKSITSMTMTVSYRVNSTDSFTVLPAVVASPSGEFFIGITAQEFIFNFKGTSTTGARINRMTVMFEYVNNATNRAARVSEGFIS